MLKSYLLYLQIGSVQVEMLLIDAEVDYQKKMLLEACKVDYLAAILPIAKACLRVSTVLLSPTELVFTFSITFSYV